MDLEAVETALRAAILAAGAPVLAELLATVGCGRRPAPLVCACGSVMESHGVDPKVLVTLLGPTPYARSVYVCPACGARRHPADEALDVSGTRFSPGVRRLMARAGARGTFQEGSDDLWVYAGLDISAKSVERVAEAVGKDLEAVSQRERAALVGQEPPACPVPSIPVLYIQVDGTGVPMVPEAVQGRAGKQPDGRAKTREAKLACVFTQCAIDAEGRPVREPGSTTWVGAIETSEAFGERVYAEAVRRGLYCARKVVVLGDGAEWIQTLVETHFPQAQLILDLYHAKEHVAQLARLLFVHDPAAAAAWCTRAWTWTEAGDVDTVLEEARALAPDPLPDEVRGELNYLACRRAHMHYDDYRAHGLYVGSGIIEAGCGSVIGLRLKRSGMEWTVRGANAIISLRCMLLSNRVEDYWADRATA